MFFQYCMHFGGHVWRQHSANIAVEPIHSKKAGLDVAADWSMQQRILHGLLYQRQLCRGEVLWKVSHRPSCWQRFRKIVAQFSWAQLKDAETPSCQGEFIHSIGLLCLQLAGLLGLQAFPSWSTFEGKDFSAWIDAFTGNFSIQGTAQEDSCSHQDSCLPQYGLLGHLLANLKRLDEEWCSTDAEVKARSS